MTYNFSFIGCIGKMSMNNEHMYFAEKKYQPKLLKGKGTNELQNDKPNQNFFGLVTLGCVFDNKCFGNTKCDNGICVENKGNKSCQCKSGWTGKFLKYFRTKDR